MAGIYHPSRGGTRGGKDQFNWDDVKSDKERENYLGNYKQNVSSQHTTLYGRCYDVKTLKRRPYNVVLASCAGCVCLYRPL